MKMRHIFSGLLLLFSATSQAQSVVARDLYITDTIVQLAGKKRQAIAINGSIPGPELHFTEGDSVVIRVHNLMHHETSIHWHGLLLPNEQDGVPYLTTSPIMAMSTHTYRFRLRQSGTYWYHSHTMLQEQVGMYGAFIIHHKKGEYSENQKVLLLSDWSNENPHQIERSLHYATDWYMIKKQAVQSYSEAIISGNTGVKLENEFKRMHAMDVSDVYYEKFLVNGKERLHFPEFGHGNRVRFRVINGSASTYFWLYYPGYKITVVASDGMDVEPVEVDRLIVGVSETYDVEVEVPHHGMAAFAATSEDRMGTAQVWLGTGHADSFSALPRLDYFAGMKMMNDMMKLNGRMTDMGMNMSLQQMDMNMVMYTELREKKGAGAHEHHGHQGGTGFPVTLNYNMLRATSETKLPPGPVTEYRFELTGNMNRYVWTVDNKTISESDMILIRPGENVRMIIVNNSMMRHPMHLHGHFFRIVNRHGSYSPLKNVLDIMPMETDTIEFHASESYGYWYFHCHILYHMMAGMGRIFEYENTPPNAQLPDFKKSLKKVYADDRRFYAGAEIGLESNGSDGEFSLMNTRWKFDAEWRLGLNNKSGYETESHFGRIFGRNQFVYAYTGWDWRYRNDNETESNIFGQTNTNDLRNVWCAGVQYTLPWFVVADVRIDHTGYFRLQLRREDIALTPRIRLWGMVNSDLEYAVGSRYILTKYISASAHYDSDMGVGAGITITY